MPRSRAITLSALLLVAACGDEPAAPLPVSSLEVVQGPPASVTPGADTVTIIVRATDAAGRGRPGEAVAWGVRAGGGHLEPLAERTGPDGLVAARWVIGPFLGDQRIAVSLPTEAGLELAAEATAFTADVVDAGYGYACALRTGETWCFGAETGGYAGNDADEGERPVRRFPGIRATELAVGNVTACVLDEAGVAWCRGVGFGRLGFGRVGQRIEGLPPLRRLSSGDDLYCGLSRIDATAWCWGLYQQVTQLSSTISFIDAAAGGGFTTPFACGLATDGETWCWRGETLAPEPAVPSAVSITGGGGLVCVRNVATDAYCWGLPRVQGVGATPTRIAEAVTDVHPGQGRILVASAGQYRIIGGGESESAERFARLRPRSFSADYDFCAIVASGAVYCTPRAAGRGRVTVREPSEPGFWVAVAVPVPAEN